MKTRTWLGRPGRAGDDRYGRESPCVEAREDRSRPLDLTLCGVVHDFGNCLLAIQAGLTIIGRTVPHMGREREILNDLTQRVQDAHALVRRMTTLGRSDDAPQPVVDLRATVQDMHTLLQCLSGDVPLSVSLDQTHCPVRAVEPELRQVVSNLVINARDAIANPSSGEIHLDVTARRAPAGPVLTVSDTGVGMHQDIMARAFEPFFTTKDADHGTGLGLPTTKGIIERQGGTISLDSYPGRGTTVRIEWPDADGEAST